MLSHLLTPMATCQTLKWTKIHEIKLKALTIIVPPLCLTTEAVVFLVKSAPLFILLHPFKILPACADSVALYHPEGFSQ